MHWNNFICLVVLSVIFFVVNSLAIKDFDVSFKVRLNEFGQFVDTFGRVRMFHGFNSVMKSFPWFDKQILNETRLKLYEEWGFNIVRLGSMWSGFQPTQGEYNSTYISILMQIIRKLQQYGLYSLLDMHQDVISSKFSSYDGIPLWLVEKFPDVPNIYKFPFPLNENKTYFWGYYYITYAASDAFQNLYTSEIGLKSWENIWAKIASIFNKQNSVIGYELFNEPWVGNFYEDPRRLLPGYAGMNNLLPAYDRLVKAIRQFDNDTLVFYEPVTYGAYLRTVGDMGTGFNRVPGGETEKSRLVLSYHYYCFLIYSANSSQDYDIKTQKICDDFFAKMLFESVKSNVNYTGGGSLLTEFGGCIPDGNNKSINTIECNAVLKLADQYYQSFTYWDSSFFDETGNTKYNVVKSFARSYPRALQGQPLDYNFDIDNGIMSLSYIIDTNIKAPTEIFLPISVHYKSGFKNITSPTMKTFFDKTNNILLIIAPSNIKKGTKVSISIFPKGMS